MRKWLYDNPWIWVALFLGALVAGSMVTLVIAELNKPEIVKEKRVSVLGHKVPTASLNLTMSGDT